MILRGTVFSNILGKDTGITIVTPGNLQEGGPYKVAYLLHGLCGDSAPWVDDSMLPVYAREGRTIFILPDAARSFYSDMRHGPRYFTYLVEELPQPVTSMTLELSFSMLGKNFTFSGRITYNPFAPVLKSVISMPRSLRHPMASSSESVPKREKASARFMENVLQNESRRLISSSFSGTHMRAFISHMRRNPCSF